MMGREEEEEEGGVKLNDKAEAKLQTYRRKVY